MAFNKTPCIDFPCCATCCGTKCGNAIKHTNGKVGYIGAWNYKKPAAETPVDLFGQDRGIAFLSWPAAWHKNCIRFHGNSLRQNGTKDCVRVFKNLGNTGVNPDIMIRIYTGFYILKDFCFCVHYDHVLFRIFVNISDRREIWQWRNQFVRCKFLKWKKIGCCGFWDFVGIFWTTNNVYGNCLRQDGKAIPNFGATSWMYVENSRNKCDGHCTGIWGCAI